MAKTQQCQMCKGAARGCAVCRQTGLAPTTLDLKQGSNHVSDPPNPTSDPIRVYYRNYDGGYCDGGV